MARACRMMAYDRDRFSSGRCSRGATTVQWGRVEPQPEALREEVRLPRRATNVRPRKAQRSGAFVFLPGRPRPAHLQRSANESCGARLLVHATRLDCARTEDDARRAVTDRGRSGTREPCCIGVAEEAPATPGS